MSPGPSLCPETQPRLRLISNLRQGRQTQGLRTGARRAGNSRPNTPRAPPTPPHLLPLTQCLLLSSSPATDSQDQAICEQERRRPTGGHRDFWRQWGGCSEGWETTQHPPTRVQGGGSSPEALRTLPSGAPCSAADAAVSDTHSEVGLQLDHRVRPLLPSGHHRPPVAKLSPAHALLCSHPSSSHAHPTPPSRLPGS